MGFRQLTEKLVGLGDSMTQDMQAKVTHIPWKSQDAQGKVTPGSKVLRNAHVDLTQSTVRTSAGELVPTQAHLTFLRPVVINIKDTFILPNGVTGPIVKVTGYLDPSTNAGYVTEVWLG